MVRALIDSHDSQEIHMIQLLTFANTSFPVLTRQRINLEYTPKQCHNPALRQHHITPDQDARYCFNTTSARLPFSPPIMPESAPAPASAPEHAPEPIPTSRSPSPVTAPPIAAAPGPRASALQKLYHDAIAHTLKTCSYTNFASCFPTPAKHAPDAMKDLHSDFIQKLHHTCKAS